MKISFPKKLSNQLVSSHWGRRPGKRSLRAAWMWRSVLVKTLLGIRNRNPLISAQVKRGCCKPLWAPEAENAVFQGLAETGKLSGSEPSFSDAHLCFYVCLFFSPFGSPDCFSLLKHQFTQGLTCWLCGHAKLWLEDGEVISLSPHA